MAIEAFTIAPRWRWPSFWSWWRDGLIAWFPLSVQRWLAGSLRQLVIVSSSDGWILLRDEAGQLQELERLEPLTSNWDAIAKWFRTEKPHNLVLRLQASQALVRVLSLPLAAESNLRQVAGFEMDRLTPFTAAQVYYDVAVLERLAEQRRLRVELVALPQSSVEPLLLSLRQRGLLPDIVDITDARPGLNLLPPEQRARRGFWERGLWIILIIMALFLAAAASLLPIWQERQLLIRTMAEADRLQPAANQALALRDQLDQAIETSRMLTRKKQALPAKVEVLRELTTIFPDDTWLERLQMKGDSTQLVGQSAKASALVGIIENSKLLNSTSFLSPVTVDPRFGKERFVLSAKIGVEP